MPVISVQNLIKEYSIYKKEPGMLGSLKSLVSRRHETVRAVDTISFDIEEGELIGFIGPNGAGKTTTLKCLSGLLYPTSGKVNVLGNVPFSRKPKFLKQISLVMGQKNQLWWDLPAVDSFLLNKEIYEIPNKQYKDTLQNLATLLEVEDFLQVQVRKLSLGQRMKMELIGALLHNPKVLFLDEPTIGLDVVMQQKLREFVKEYNEKYHATILLTSHYMGDVEALCKRVIVINHGVILFDGLLDDLVKKHAPYKIITIALQKTVDPKILEDLGEIKKFQYPELIIRVPAEKASEDAAKILSTLPVADVNIENPEIEDIIRDVFTMHQS